MSYLLRRVILEDRWQVQLTELIDLCRRVPIEEVLLMEQSHQLLMVPYPLEKHRRMADIYAQMAEELRRNGIVFSVNLASLVGHADTPVDASLILPFQKFVGADLRAVRANYCILDDAWQNHAAEVCAIYARSRPDKMFIDDDFRSLNHSHPFGCFCPLHVSKTSKTLGFQLTDHELRSCLCGAGERDLAVRAAWLRINFEGQLAAARKMRLATGKVSPVTRLGLMNSGEPSHAVQGREMARLLCEFAGPDHRPLSRPAGGAYEDCLGAEIFNMHQRMALSVTMAGSNVQIVSEVENWPHTRFTKSLFSTRFQMEMHALAGAEDFTLNIYDYLATPFQQEPEFEKLLREMKDRLRIIQESRKDKVGRGFGLPWRPDIVKHRINRSGDLADLMPERELDALLPRFGLPTQFAPARGNAILGDDVLAYPDREIESLLTGGLLLDALAANHLIQRGYADWIGCRVGEPLLHGTVEELSVNEFCGPFAGNLLCTNWSRLDPQKRHAYRLELASGARAITLLRDLEMRALAPGTVLFENAKGGRVVVLAAPVDSYSWLFRAKSHVVARLVHWLMMDDVPVWIEDCPNVGPLYYENPFSGEGLLAIVSGSLDPMTVRIHTRLRLQDLFSSQTVDDGHPIHLEGMGIHLYRTFRSPLAS